MTKEKMISISLLIYRFDIMTNNIFKLTKRIETKWKEDLVIWKSLTMY